MCVCACVKPRTERGSHELARAGRRHVHHLYMGRVSCCRLNHPRRGRRTMAGRGDDDGKGVRAVWENAQARPASDVSTGAGAYLARCGRGFGGALHPSFTCRIACTHRGDAQSAREYISSKEPDPHYCPRWWQGTHAPASPHTYAWQPPRWSRRIRSFKCNVCKHVAHLLTGTTPSSHGNGLTWTSWPKKSKPSISRSFLPRPK